MKRATRFVLDAGWQFLLKDMGISAKEVLAYAGLPMDIFSRKDASVSVEEFFALWRGLEKAAKGVELPLAIGRHISVEVFNPMLFSCFCSPNMNVAVKRLSTYKRLCGPMNINITDSEDAMSISADCMGYTPQIPPSLGAMDMVFFTQLGRLATREQIEPIEVVFAHEPDAAEEYEAFFGIPVTAGDEYRIVFSAEDAQRPFLSENNAMWEFFEPKWRTRLADLEAGASTSQRVRAALLELLPRGQAGADDAAGELAMSKRTLQRKLTSEGKSFQAILKDTRKELAQHYLRQSAIPQGEISFLLGFQDTNSFTRAFSSWTGQTPGEYRSTANN